MLNKHLGCDMIKQKAVVYKMVFNLEQIDKEGRAEACTREIEVITPKKAYSTNTYS